MLHPKTRFRSTAILRATSYASLRVPHLRLSMDLKPSINFKNQTRMCPRSSLMIAGQDMKKLSLLSQSPSKNRRSQRANSSSQRLNSFTGQSSISASLRLQIHYRGTVREKRKPTSDKKRSRTKVIRSRLKARGSLLQSMPRKLPKKPLRKSLQRLKKVQLLRKLTSERKKIKQTTDSPRRRAVKKTTPNF